MKALLSTVFLGALTWALPANAEQVRFFGSFMFIAHSTDASCPDYNPEGDRGVARFRPQVTGSDNGTGARFGIFFQDGGYAWQLPSGNFNVGAESAFRPTRFASVFDGVGFLDTTDTPVARVRFLSQSPASITTATQTVTIVAELQNFDFQTGCTPKIRLMMHRRPEN